MNISRTCKMCGYVVNIIYVYDRIDQISLDHKMTCPFYSGDRWYENKSFLFNSLEEFCDFFGYLV